MAKPFDFLVVFKDGQELIINDVCDYWIKDKEYTLAVIKNNRHHFFNWGEVKYCGRLSDLRNDKKQGD